MLIFRRTIVLVQPLVSSLSLGDCSAHRLGEDSHLKRVTITDAVLIQFVLLKMSIIVLETCRGIYNECIKIKNLCIKLVKKTIISFILIRKFLNSHFQSKTASLNSDVCDFVHSFHLNAGLLLSHVRPRLFSFTYMLSNHPNFRRYSLFLRRNFFGALAKLHKSCH